MFRFILLIYTFLYSIFIIFLLPQEYLKRPKELRNRWLREKFGFFSKKNSNPKPKIWFHAVSVGEVIAVSSLIKKLSQEYEILLSTITDTGQKVAAQRFKDFSVTIIYLPFDIPSVIERTIKTFNPKALILTETELWPNLIWIASKKFPVILINGRLSDKSFAGYKKLKFFMEPIIRKLTLICIQNESYRYRFIKLGAHEEKLYVTGNLKFDIELEKMNFEWENDIPKPVILAGSTHYPEEEMILEVFLNLKLKGTLLIAPRHPERFEEVRILIEKKLSTMKRKISLFKLSEFCSKLKDDNEANIILVDKIGILGSLYRICDIAIIGGSFIPHGGQNPLEPAYWKKPIICGPHMNNFPFIEEFAKEKACLIIDKASFPEIMKKLISDSEFSQNLGRKAHEILQRNRGAAEKTLELLNNLIKEG